MTLSDGGDGVVADNDNGGTSDTVTYLRNGSNVTVKTDSSLEYFATVLHGDGSTANIEVVLFQLENGDTFVSDIYNNGFLDNQTIQSITLTGVKMSAAVGWYSDQNTENTTIVCFAAGTLISTTSGPVPVERLRVGDRIQTLDHGEQAIRWIGSRRVAAKGKFAPVRLRAGALAPGVPQRDLLVSPQHRILVRSRVAQRMSGSAEALIPARKLVGMPGIEVAGDLGHITYWHMLFDRHEIVLADGALAESLFLGDQSLLGVGRKARAEIEALFPELHRSGLPQLLARPALFGRRARNFVQRHRKNRIRLIDQAIMA